MNDLLKRLNMNHISDLFDECYEKVSNEKDTPIWLTEEYIRKAIKDCNMSDELLDIVLPAVCEVKENKDLVLFAKTLSHMLKIRKHHEEVFGGLEFPSAPEGANTRPYDLFSFFPMLYHVHEAYLELVAKGVNEDFLQNTYKGACSSIVSSFKKTGRATFPTLYFLWNTTYKNASLFKMGTFNFEVRENIKLQIRAFINNNGEIKLLMKEGIKVHKDGFILGSAGADEKEDLFVTEFIETDEYWEGNESDNEKSRINREKIKLYKNDWTLLYAPGDNLISIHIPRTATFDPETIENSLNEGREFFKKIYPEKAFKGFMCISWLLAPELKDILKPTSNILAFRDRYIKFPVLCSGLDIFNFVFQNPVSSLSEVDLNSLPENTSLERSLKEMYKNGKYLHETGGIFSF